MQVYASQKFGTLIVYSISFSSVECEWGFSKQNLIKTK